MLAYLKELKKIQAGRPLRFVFVCTANCCRSPLAEILFEKIVKDHHSRYELLIESAATSFSGFSIAEKSAQILCETEGINPRRCRMHTGRHLSEIDQPDLILAMTVEHKKSILASFPAWQPLTFTLEEFVYHDSGRRPLNIADPIGGTYAQFNQMKNQVKDALLLLYQECREAGLFRAT